MSTLYLVSTPIGNLADITLRALEILKKVDIILAEDTRKSGRLLKHHNIKSKMLSYQEYNEKGRIPQIINLLKNGREVALISDAGTPTVSDPGFKLVCECIRENINIQAVPGPSSILYALIVSGLPTDKFCFLGYLPRKETQLKKLFKDLDRLSSIVSTTYISFESPYRILKTLEVVSQEYPDLAISLCRELTKIHEEVIRGRADDIYGQMKKKSRVKGEITLVFHFNFNINRPNVILPSN